MFRTLLEKLDHGDASAARNAFTPKTDQLGESNELTPTRVITRRC